MAALPQIGVYQPPSFGDRVKSILRRLLSAALEFSAHCALLAVLLLGMKGVERFAVILWGAGRIFRFGSATFAMQALFDGADLSLIVCILCIGGYATIRTYWG
jgi:hypothetical protein